MTSHSEEETIRIGARFARELRPANVIALVGPIGSGKTLLIKGVCQGWGVDPDQVKSPTFVLLHIYPVPRRLRKRLDSIHHFDLYRLEREGDLGGIGLEEFIRDPRAISVIEWADRAPDWIPRDAVWVEIKITGPASREMRVGS